MKQLVCNKSSSGHCSVSHPAGCVQLQSGTNVCVCLSLWTTGPSGPAVAQTHTHSHCRACGVSNAAAAFCVSARVGVCVWFTVQSESSCLRALLLPSPRSLCKHSTSAVITGKPTKALSPLPTAELSLSPVNPTPRYMVDTHQQTNTGIAAKESSHRHMWKIKSKKGVWVNNRFSQLEFFFSSCICGYILCCSENCYVMCNFC